MAASACTIRNIVRYLHHAEFVTDSDAMLDLHADETCAAGLKSLNQDACDSIEYDNARQMLQKKLTAVHFKTFVFIL